VVQSEFPRLKEFLAGLRKSWEQATKSMEKVYKNMKKQFNKKRQNSQGLKVRDNVWLENKNIQLNQLSKKLDQKQYRPFRISKDIGLGAFQLELPEGWTIHNVFNENLLIQCIKPKFKE